MKPYGARIGQELIRKRGRLQRNMVRVSHLATALLGSWFPEKIPMVFVVAYTKSGNTWTGQLIADCLQLPFPQNALLPIGFPAVFHTHYQVWKRFPRGVYLVRDGRDIMTSLYNWGFVWRDRPTLSSLGKKARDENDIAAFVEWQMTAKKPIAEQSTWPAHVRRYFDCAHPNFQLTRYEDMLSDGEATLSKIVSGITGEEADLERVRAALSKYSFTKQTGRTPGQEADSGTGTWTWARKGVAGDWVNHFTPEAAQVFDHYAGDVLIKLGYEQDHSWVDSFSKFWKGS